MSERSLACEAVLRDTLTNGLYVKSAYCRSRSIADSAMERKSSSFNNVNVSYGSKVNRDFVRRFRVDGGEGRRGESAVYDVSPVIVSVRSASSDVCRDVRAALLYFTRAQCVLDAFRWCWICALLCEELRIVYYNSKWQVSFGNSRLRPTSSSLTTLNSRCECLSSVGGVDS